jgi:acetyltransferase
LALDDQTDAILIYAEAITNPRKFMSAARAASRIKPVIAVKPGRHAEAARAAATHTGALAGADRVVDAVLRRAGILRVNDIEDLFDAAEVTGRYRPLAAARTAIITNGGGAGVLAVDELLDRGASPAELSPPTVERLNEMLPPTWSHANPIDIIGDAPPERYSAAIRAAADDERVDALLVMNCPTGIADPLASARAVVDLTRHGVMNGKPVLTCWLGSAAATPARALLQRAGVGSFDTPAHAAEGVALLTRWSKLRAQLEQVPSDEVPAAIDAVRVRQVLDAVAADRRTILTEPEAKAVLASIGIAVPQTLTCATEADVEKAAEQMLTRGPKVVVKLLSRQITHKSDVGGVVLDLSSATDARVAARAIRERVAAAYPSAILDGFTVQPMIEQRHARELLAGLITDTTFGPMIVFGAGGTAVEVIDDTAIGVAPLDAQLAADIVGRTRISKVLAGYRDVPAADMAAVTEVLVALSQLATLFPEITSVDINPLLASADGAMALDARIVVDPTRRALAAPNPDLIIRPCPSGEGSEALIQGTEITIRPIRPSDATLYPRFMQRMDPEDLRRRFLTPTATLSRQLLVRLTQLDYDRDMAFVALEGPDGDLAGIVRYSADPDHLTAEYGILVRSDLKGRGLGRTMMHRLIDFARRDGVTELCGMILPDNERMLGICRDLGFQVEERVPGENLVRATLKLQPQ